MLTEILISCVCFLKFAFQPVNLNESASTKRHHQTLALNASSNGGDASRVGLMKGLLSNSCIFSRRGTRRPH